MRQVHIYMHMPLRRAGGTINRESLEVEVVTPLALSLAVTLIKMMPCTIY